MRQRAFVPGLVILLLAILTTAALAADGFDLSWWTVDSGGERLSSTSYQLDGTAGQPDSNATLSSGGFTLSGGYWAGHAGQVTGSYIYMPLVVKEN
jgi:hypothetical protein